MIVLVGAASDRLFIVLIFEERDSKILRASGEDSLGQVEESLVTGVGCSHDSSLSGNQPLHLVSITVVVIDHVANLGTAVPELNTSRASLGRTPVLVQHVSLMGRLAKLLVEPLGVSMRSSSIASIHAITIVATVNKVLLSQVKTLQRSSSLQHARLVETSGTESSTGSA